MDETKRAALIMAAVAHAQLLCAGMVAENARLKVEGLPPRFVHADFYGEALFLERRVEVLR